MAADSDTPEVSDTIVVGGELSDDSVDESAGDYESSDGSGEDEDRDELAGQQQTSSNARSSVPPIDHSIAERAQQADVSEEPAAENSMLFSSEPEALKSPSLAHSSAYPQADMPAHSASSVWPDTSAETAPANPEDISDEKQGPVAAESPDIQTLLEGITQTEPEESKASLPSLPVQSPSTASISASAPASASAFAHANAPTPTPAPAPAPAASSSVVGPASLPPKPNLPAQKTSPNAPFPQDFPSFQNPNSVLRTAPPALTTASPVAATSGPHNWTAVASGHPTNAASSLPPPPSTAYNGAQPTHSVPNAMPTPGAGPPPGSALHTPSTEQDWDMFQADERRYMTEAKWERFPDGSRVFIGNLSSDKVSKREVFDVFHKFGRLAQIALKSAYGFVQYHTVEDAQRAMQAAEGAELGGRQIHLEASRAQKKDKREERDRSPGDRRNSNRGNRADRYDGREQGGRHGRDDYRPRRSPSPRRHDRGGRDGYGHGRDRDFRGSNDRRGRSRSPNRFGRSDGGNPYRRRSPSPRRMSHDTAANFGHQTRFGANLPDVQFILMQQLDRQFIEWVEKAFQARGLQTQTMYFNPQFNHDNLMQHFIREGVQAVVELTAAHQNTSKIQITVFNRSNPQSVRYDRYDNLDPSVAADVVVREKSQYPQGAPTGQPTYAAPYQAQPPSNYPSHPQPSHPQPSHPQQSHPQQYGQYANYYSQGGYAAGYAYPNLPQQPPAAPTAAPATAYADASKIGGLDNASLQRLLSSLQPSAAGVPQSSQVDINALLGNLKNAAGAGANVYQNLGAYATAASGSNPATPSVPPHNMSMNGARPGGADTNPQALLDTLHRFRK